MSWQILLTISIFAFSISTILQKVLLKSYKADPITLAVLFQLLPGTMILVFAIVHGYDLVGVKKYFPNIFLSSLLYTCVNIFMFKSLKKIDVSNFTVIMSSRAIWTIMGAVLVLGEHFSTLKIMGTLLILISIVLVSWSKEKVSLNQGAIFAILASMFLGLSFVNDAFTVNHVDVLSYEASSFILTSICISIIMPKSIFNIPRFFKNKELLSRLIILVIMYTTYALSYIFSYKFGQNASQIAPISQTTTILTIMLSIIFLGERSEVLRKLLSGVLSFIGILLVG